jgi:hypothetical protein
VPGEWSASVDTSNDHGKILQVPSPSTTTRDIAQRQIIAREAARPSQVSTDIKAGAAHGGARFCAG